MFSVFNTLNIREDVYVHLAITICIRLYLRLREKLLGIRKRLSPSLTDNIA